jgi:hypothetical protein
VVAADVATAALPNASTARVSASTARATSSVDRLAAGASASAQALAPRLPPRLLVRGAQAPTSQGGLRSVALFFFSLSR